MFGFGHRTFQEYFAARGLLLEAEGGGDIVALLRQYLFHLLWEEVIVYVAASLAAPRATTLLRVILDDPDPAGRFLRRGQRLVLRCLIDGTTIGDRVLLDQVFSGGEAIGKSRWLGISVQFVDLLKQLSVTRYEPEARRMLVELENAAKKALPDGDYRDWYLSSHNPPAPPKEDIPGTICRKCLGGRQVKLVWPALKKRIEDPQAWFAQALSRAQNPGTDIMCRKVLISFLGAEADTNAKAKNAVKKLLKQDPLAHIRAESAEALTEIASSKSDVKQLLLDRLDNDESDLVRASCAMALGSVAATDDDVRVRLERLFAKSRNVVRSGAARGLSRIDLVSAKGKDLLDQILGTIRSSREPSCVRCACIWAVASFVEHDAIAAVIEICLDDADSDVQRVALHVLGDAITDGEMEWSNPLAAKLQAMLMAVSDPCLHLFHDLVALVTMKELRGQRRLDRLLGDSLASFGERIQMAFVFGSVARDKQVEESDIDLMVIGEVRLKELAAALHPAEQTLGRPVNPVLFSAEKFREHYRQGNPLLLDVVRKEKIFLKGSRDELTELVADRARG
jgi:predicted nucleotidyltransferase